MIRTILALFLAGAPAMAADPTMTVTPVPGKGYTIAVSPFPAADREKVMDRMSALAEQKCGALKPRWGRFEYDMAYPNGANAGQWFVNYRQRLVCFDPANDPFKPAPDDWKPTEADNAAATAAVNRYLDLFEKGDVRALALLEPSLEMKPDEWLAQPNTFKGLIGTGSRELAGPFWRVNPTAAGHPGAYVMFAFRGTYSGMAAYCGVLTMYRAAPDTYQISVQRIQAITKAAVAAGRISSAATARACDDLLR